MLSGVLHAGALTVVLAARPAWAAALSAVAANHALLLGASLAPRSALLGANLRRLPPAATARGALALTFDDGPEPHVTPAVLDLLDAFGARATFFCVGERVRAHPALAREIVRRGHAVENHTQQHSRAFGFYGWTRLQREIGLAQATIADATGTAPRFFRAPFGMRNPLLDPVLAGAGLQLVSWTARGYDTVDSDVARVLGRLHRALAPGAILLLHDGMATGRREGAVVLAVLPHLLRALTLAKLQTITLPQATNLPH
jgi:peptidoglycan/xylan/chitin deacetylase (PgdA/CDA1 family)